MSIVELPDGPPPAGQVKLRVAFCGICGSDLHEYESASPPRALGFLQPVMGHEFSGRVVAVGEGVAGIGVGQLATGNPGAGCGNCRYCLAGRENLCRNTGGGTGYALPGAYAEFVTLPERSVVRLPEGTDLHLAALTEPLSVARHALAEANYRPDELLVIAGAGPIGLLTALAARHLGGTRIIVSEPLAGRRGAAVRAGVPHVVEPAQLALAARSISDGEGADVCVDATGLPAGIGGCVDAAARGARIVLAGVGETPYPIEILRSVINEFRYIAILGYSRREFAESAAMIASDQVDVSPLISEVVPVADTPHAFARLSGGRDSLNKILVSPDA